MLGRRAPVRSATSAVTGLLLTSVAVSRLGCASAFSVGPAGFRRLFSSPAHAAPHVSPALRGASTAPSLRAGNLGHPRIAGRHYSATMAAASGVRSEYDEEQLRLLDSDECIIVNEKDEVIGSGSKKFCHLMDNIRAGKALHRAFSVFVFNAAGELLLQKRSDDKILFPQRWTNTCCSHPLYNDLEMDNPPSPDASGVKRAVVRKLEHELGIPHGQVPAEGMQYMTRILYEAAVGEDDTWGEHEVDYILLAQADVHLDLNPNEVSEVRYLKRSELEGLLAAEEKGELMLSPWFRACSVELLPKWWDAILTGKVEEAKDTGTIHSLQS